MLVYAFLESSIFVTYDNCMYFLFNMSIVPCKCVNNVNTKTCLLVVQLSNLLPSEIRIYHFLFNIFLI